MSLEPLIEDIVRNVVERLAQDQPVAVPSGTEVAGSLSSANVPTAIQEIYQQYRALYCLIPPSEEKFPLDFDSRLSQEWGQPLFCIYEKHLPCDSCGRCEVRGF